MYSLSTCWNSNRHTDGREMLREIRGLGFDYAELSHGIRISLVPGILEAVQAGEIKLTSLHNFCPLPVGVSHAAPNLFKFSSPDPRERENAYRYTLKTLELAQRLGAPVVVLHLGAIVLDGFMDKLLSRKDYTDRLLNLLEKGQKDTPKYQKLCQQATDRREKKKEKYVQLAYEMLHRLAEQAEVRGIKLGVENREAIEEIPLESDLSLLFREFPGSAVGYWHDTGHAQIKEHLGLIQHALHLETYAEQLLGFHIHDVRYPGQDHCPPGTGTIDFAALKPWVKPQHLKILEMNPGIPAEQVLAGFSHLKSVWGDE